MYVVHRAPTYKGYIPYTARVIAQATYRRALSRTVKAEPSQGCKLAKKLNDHAANSVHFTPKKKWPVFKRAY